MARRCAGSGCRGGAGGVAGRPGGGGCVGGLMAGGGVVVEREGAQYCVVGVIFCDLSGNEGGASGPVRSSRKTMLNVILFR
jgi:hypothetical protein